MLATLVDVMGDDLRVVNAARVSFNKESDWEHEKEWDPSRTFYMEYPGRFLSEKDQKLIKYLATHNHWTPFSHVVITMREKVPIFVARQRFKHTVGFTYNEVSRRYVDEAPSFYIPDVWRGRSENAKQGSSDQEIYNILDTFGEAFSISSAYIELIEHAHELYSLMLKNGVAPEQARMILPQSMYTEYYVTGSLAAWARAYKLRASKDAQKEIQDLATQWNEIIRNIPELKYSWQALVS